jgi:Uncharacterised nucleotidyltransferase
MENLASNLARFNGGDSISWMATVAEPRPPTTKSLAIRPFPRSLEFDLLAACCAVEPSTDRIRKIFSRPLSWERLLHLADHHRVIPQLYGALSAFPDLLSANARAALRSRYQENAQRALRFTGELLRTIHCFESPGIKALAYKGPVLAQTLYGDVTERQYSDLDILIRPEDVPKAKAVLQAAGHACYPQLREQEESAYIASGCGYVFHTAAGRNLLDLQWRIVPRFYSIDFDMAGFLDRSDEIIVGGSAVRTLCAQDLLLVLCVHAAKHVWVQLSWLCDITKLVKSAQLDWNAIQHEAQRLGIERIVNVNLLLAHKVLEMPLPSLIGAHVIEDPSIIGLADEILPIIKRSTHDTESAAYFRLMLRMRERWQDRVRFLSRLIFTPSVSEWNTVRLPKSLQSMYRVVRLSRLVKRLAVSV